MIRVEYQGTLHEFPESFSQEQIQKALKSYTPAVPETERPLGDVVSDIPYQLASGVGSGIKGVGTLAGMVVPGGTINNPITRLGEWQQENARSGLSASYKAREERLNRAAEEAAQKDGQLSAAWTTAKGLATDPALFFGKAVEQVPQFLPQAAAGMATKAAMLARGIQPTKSAVMTAVLGTGATQQSADVAGNVYDETLQQTKDPELARDRAIQAFITSVPASLASQLAFGSGGTAFERVLAGTTGRQLGAKQFVKAVVGEPASEITEETSGAFIANVQARKNDPTVPLSRNLGRTAGEAGMLGLGMGVAGGTMESLAAPRPETVSQSVKEDIDTLRNAYNERKAEEEKQLGAQIYESYKQEIDQTRQQEFDQGNQIWKDYLEEVGPQLDLPFDAKKKRKTRSDKGKKMGQQELAFEQPEVPKQPSVPVTNKTKTLYAETERKILDGAKEDLAAGRIDEKDYAGIIQDPWAYLYRVSDRERDWEIDHWNKTARPPKEPTRDVRNFEKAEVPARLFVNKRTAPAAIFNWFKTDPKIAPERKLLAGVVEKYLGPDLKIIATTGAEYDRAYGTNKASLQFGGFYHPQEHAVYLNTSKDANGLNSQTVLHELLHAATARLVMRYTTELDGKPVAVMGSPRVITDLITLFRHVKQHKQFNEDYYGMTNLDEFIAETFANPLFQQYLASIPYTTTDNNPKSVWSKFIDLIAKLFEFPIQKKNVLAEALSLSGKAMELQQQEHVALAKHMNVVYRAAEYRPTMQAVNEALKGEVEQDRFLADGKHEEHMKDQEDAKDKVFENLGIETNRIPDDPDVADPGLIARILQDQDGSAKWDWAYPGALQAADIRNSVLIRNVYRLMDNAYKRAKKFERDFVAPLENTWSKLLRNRKSTLKLHQVFKLELENGENFTNAELSQILSQEELAAYTDMRDVLELSWKEQNKALVAVGLKEVTKMESYYAARWRGPYRTILRDKDGKIVWVIAERTRGRAQTALKWVQQRHPDLQAEEVRYYKGRDTENMLQAGYLELIKLLDMTDPNSIAIHEAWKEAIIGTTENVLGQEKHFKRKSGVQGFAGARPWEDNYTDAKEFFIEQIKYMKNAAQWSAMQVPARKVKDLLSNEQIAKSQPNNVKYAKAYLRNHLGYSTWDWVENLEQSLSSLFGKDVEFSENILGGLKSLFYVAQLGFNVPYSIYAAIQPTLGAGKHANFTSEGYHHNLGLTTALAFRDGLAFSLAHLGRWMNHTSKIKAAKNIGNTMDTMFRKMQSENGKIATEYIEANGVVDVTPVTDIMDLRVPAWVSKARNYGGWTISAVEILSRSMAFYSFVHHLAQADKRNLTTDDVLIMADDATKDIMADYRPNERAMLFNNAGLTGKGLATLQTFKFNWMAQVLKYWKLGQTTGRWRPFVMQMTAYMTMAGLAGFIGIDDADDIWRYTLSQLPDSEFAKWKNYSPKMLIMRELPTLVSYGAISGVTGTNIYTRGSLGDVIPFNPQKGVGENVLNFFPFLSTGAAMAYGLLRGGMELTGTGNRDTNLAAIHKGMPAALKGPFEVQSGLYEENGTLLSLQDPSLGIYRRTDEDRFARMWGLRTLREAQATEGRYRHRDIKIETDKRRGAAGNDFWSAALKGDNRNAVVYLQRYIELGGDPRHLLSVARMKEAQKRLTLGYLEQLALRAKPQNQAAIREFIEYMQYYSPTYEE